MNFYHRVHGDNDDIRAKRPMVKLLSA